MTSMDTADSGTMFTEPPTKWLADLADMAFSRGDLELSAVIIELLYQKCSAYMTSEPAETEPLKMSLTLLDVERPTVSYPALALSAEDTSGQMLIALADETFKAGDMGSCSIFIDRIYRLHEDLRGERITITVREGLVE